MKKTTEKLQYTNIFDAITEDREESASLKMRSALLMTIFSVIESKGLKSADLEKILEVPAARVSEMRSGKISLLSCDRLLGYLKKLGYEFQVDIGGDLDISMKLSVAE